MPTGHILKTAQSGTKRPAAQPAIPEQGNLLKLPLSQWRREIFAEQGGFQNGEAKLYTEYVSEPF